ncbi:alanine racemase [Ferrimonas senticii]|uniref:alanine racemase n=1 Tax=Ferrimonas senticii TaxID=394566 RepID=UPI0004119537|nr:alanine racemase [Ferrimonas senticii]
MRFSPVAQIRLGALQHNLARLRQAAPNSKVFAVLKANAYGHGLIPIAEALSGVDGFGLARIEEALALRSHGIDARVLLLEGVFSDTDFEQAAAHHLDVVVHDASQVELLCQLKLSKPLKVWLKVDSGMHRLGVQPHEFAALYQQLSQCDNVCQPINFITHFAVADELENPQTVKQIQCFNQLTEGLPGERTLCNSAGALGWPAAHGDWIRPGLALFGGNPMVGGRAPQYGLEPVMTMRSKVLAVRHLSAAEPVGYGQSWRSNNATKIAVIAMGYGDGYPRHAVSGTPVLINGQRFPLAGRVSMDMLTVDVGDADIQVGDDVVLWGEGLGIEEIAECASTIPYELLCSTTARVTYQYLD